MLCTLSSMLPSTVGFCQTTLSAFASQTADQLCSRPELYPVHSPSLTRRTKQSRSGWPICGCVVYVISSLCRLVHAAQKPFAKTILSRKQQTWRIHYLKKAVVASCSSSSTASGSQHGSRPVTCITLSPTPRGIKPRSCTQHLVCGSACTPSNHS